VGLAPHKGLDFPVEELKIGDPPDPEAGEIAVSWPRKAGKVKEEVHPPGFSWAGGLISYVLCDMVRENAGHGGKGGKDGGPQGYQTICWETLKKVLSTWDEESVFTSQLKPEEAAIF
jgi:hypothetical protein